jgi:hypothetical protein
MPTWNLVYKIGVDSTLSDIQREQEALCSDPMCTSYQANDSADRRGWIYVQVGFNEPMNLTSQEILHRRLAEGDPAVPVVPVHMTGVDIQIDLSRTQESIPLRVGDRVGIEDGGRIGPNGTPIGTILSIDLGSNQACVRIEAGNPFGTTQLQGSRFTRQPMPTLDPIIARYRQQIMAAEDARVLEAFDAIGELTTPPAHEDPEPRRVFKTRYQRILDSFT